MIKKQTTDYRLETIERDIFFHKWLTVILWGGVFFFALKEYMNVTWEPVAGAWSIWGLFTYYFLGYLVKRYDYEFKKTSVIELVISIPTAVAILYLVFIRFFSGRETDWFSLAFGIAIAIIVASREALC